MGKLKVFISKKEAAKSYEEVAKMVKADTGWDLSEYAFNNPHNATCEHQEKECVCGLTVMQLMQLHRMQEGAEYGLSAGQAEVELSLPDPRDVAVYYLLTD